MRNFILSMILTFFLFGCVFNPQPTQLPTVKTIVPTPNIISTVSQTPFPSPKSEETKVLATVTFMPIKTLKFGFKYDFYFGATPEMNQVGGISGVFYRLDLPNETCAQTYNIFRFYEDGLVMYVPVCDDFATDDFSLKVWPSISQWFSRDQMDSTTSQGTYYIVENKIWFTTVAEYSSHIVISDYFGTFSEERLILDRFTHANGYQIKESQGKEEYMWVDISSNP